MDYNFNRGKISFWEIINKELNNFDQDEQSRIKEIAQSFENSVAIMPDEDNNVYAARRMANAILNTDLSQQKEGSIDTITTNVLVKYFSQAQNAATINKSHFVPDGKNITGNYGKQEQGKVDDFESELRSNFEKEIDLLEDLNNTELSVEGLRKKLIIPNDFDSAKQKLPEIQNADQVFGSITFNSNGEIEKITCPSCSESDVYFIAHDKYGCFKCDQDFKVPMEIGDNLN
jgi:hypothetical protein